MQIPAENCQKCPRLCNFRAENKVQFPSYWNAPVPSFGELSAELLVVGLAPGLHGANQTGRPFTGDYAGIVLYASLLKCGFAEGTYDVPFLMSFRPTEESGGISLKERSLGYAQDDSFKLVNCRITNAVRCVPQANKPEPLEIQNCNEFLRSEIAAMPNLKAILSLGLVSHNAVLRALGQKPSAAKFVHGASYKMGRITLFDSYHCSRYNINTGRLNQAMFDTVVEAIRKAI